MLRTKCFFIDVYLLKSTVIGRTSFKFKVFKSFDKKLLFRFKNSLFKKKFY